MKKLILEPLACGGSAVVVAGMCTAERLEENHIFVRNLSYSYRDGAFPRITIGTEGQMEYVAKVIKSYYEK